MDIVVKDFNCIENIEITLNPGFTILQGPSNSGKSSVIKAIENTIFNQSGTSNVRQGQDNYVVGIRKDNHTVSLVKGKNSKYKIDGQIYEKFGVNQLPEVADTLNIRETVLGGEKVRLNFSKQMSYPFLLDKTPGQLYKFIVDSSESESLSNVLKDMSKDIKSVEKDIIQYEAKIDILSKQQSQITSSLTNADIILNLSNEIIEMDNENDVLNQLTVLKDNYNIINNKLLELNAHYNNLNIEIDTQSLDTVKNDYEQYLAIADKYKGTSKVVNALSSHLQSISVDINIDNLDGQLNDYNQLIDLIKQYKNTLSNIEILKNNISDTDRLLNEEENKLKDFKVCPLCGSSIKC